MNLLILVGRGLRGRPGLGRGGRLELLGIPISIRGLYTPVMVLTVLVLARLALWVNPHVVSDVRGCGRRR